MCGVQGSDREEERSNRTSLKICRVNFTILQVHGMLAGRPLSFLIDSGAADSVVTYGILPSSVVIDCVKNSLSLTLGSAYLQPHETKKPEIVAAVSVSEMVQISAVFVKGTITHPKGRAVGIDGA